MHLPGLAWANNQHCRPVKPAQTPITDRFNAAPLHLWQVVIDNHVWLEDPTAYENPQLWVESWAKLAAAVAKDPVAKGVVLLDLVNEPDNKRIFWKGRDGRPGLGQLYIDAMDAIHKVNPSALFVLEVSSERASRACAAAGPSC